MIDLLRDALLFAVGAEDAIERIRGAARGFMIMADLQLAQQTNREQVQTCQQQHCREDHHWPVFHHYVRVTQKFFDEQPCRDTHAAEDSHHSHGAEKVQRTAQVLQQEADGDEIKKYAERARDAVVRYTAFTIDSANRHFTDRSAMPCRKGWNKAGQPAIKRDLLKNVAARGFESRSEVVNINPAQLCHQPIGAARWNA